jgi:hypothetical protein
MPFRLPWNVAEISRPINSCIVSDINHGMFVVIIICQEQVAAIVKFQGFHSVRSADESEYQKHKSVVTKILPSP